MTIISKFLIGFVAILHFYFLILEMFLWTKPYGLRVFGNNLKKAQDSAVLAANQGLYNGFLSAGLIWSLVQTDPNFSVQIASFFLACVAIAGAYGGYSVSPKIMFIQAVPALLALGSLFL